MHDDRLLLSDGSLLDLRSAQVRRPGLPPLHLEPLECSLLRYLGRRAGRCVSQDELHREVWGLPEPVTERDVIRQRQRIRKCVRKLREKIEPAPSTPRFLCTDRGGYRLDPTDGHYGGRQPAPPGQNNNLSPPGDAFVGRRRELAELEHHLQRGRSPLLIWGPGGVGKSRLARHLARSLSAEYRPDGGAWFCPLRDRRSREGLQAALSELPPLPPLRGGSPSEDAEELGSALASLGPALIVFDNIEQLEPEALADLYTWADRAPELRCIWTCRFRLDGPAVPIALAPLPEHEALELFRLRAPPAVDPRQSAALTRRLEGLPLAIELAAAGCAFTSPEALMASLSAGGGPLSRTLLEVVDGSWRLLTERERQALAACAVFRGDFDLEAFTAVLPPELSPIPLLQSLERRALLRVAPGASERRLSLPTEVRYYAELRLREGDPAAVEGRHAEHYLRRGEALLEDSQLGVPRAIAALAALGLELDAVFDRCEDRAPALAARAAILSSAIGLIRGPFHRIPSRLDPLLASGEQLPSSTRARLLLDRGAARRLLRADAAAERDLRAALALAEGEPSLRAAALSGLGMLAFQADDQDRARELLLEGLREAEAAGCWREAGRCRASLVAIERVAGRLEEAERHYRSGAAAASLAGDEACSRRLLGNLALLRRRQGRLEEAERAHREELALHEAAGDLRAAANARANLGALLLDLGQLEAADPVLGAAEAEQRRLGSSAHAAVIRGNRGLAALEAGRLTEARELLLSALHTHESLGDRRRAKDRCDLALLHLVAGDIEAAQRAIQGALEAGASRRVRGYLLAVQARLPGAAPALLDEAAACMSASRDAAGQALIAMLRAGSAEGISPPPSVYFRVLRRLL